MQEPDLQRLTFVLGGARSGKSRFAQELAERREHRVYLATAQARDDEMTARIEIHKSDRGPEWQTVEEPLDISAVLRQTVDGHVSVLVDCLTIWLSNVMLQGMDIDGEIDRLMDTLAGLAGPVILVSNEVGQGIVPASEMGREFRDHQGRLNQRMAALADEVWWVVAGLPQKLKGD